MNRDRVLIIDREQSNLDLIARLLANEPLILDLQTDSSAAWKKLESTNDHYSLVIIDSAMPDLDGIGFLHRLRANPRFGGVQVIMQTSATSPEKVSEGMQAGAYYYLFKPFRPEALISIVRGAIEDHRNQRSVRHLIKHQEAAQQLLLWAEYRFRDLHDINHLVPILAGFTPKPHLTASGLADLMVNAVEHGNLGITYQEKARLKLDGGWEAEIDRRLTLPANRDRFAFVRIEKEKTQIRYTITDQGDGFDWWRFLEFDPERAFDPNGRGIALARRTSFSGLEFPGKGNVAVASVAL